MVDLDRLLIVLWIRKAEQIPYMCRTFLWRKWMRRLFSRQQNLQRSPLSRQTNFPQFFFLWYPQKKKRKWNFFSHHNHIDNSFSFAWIIVDGVWDDWGPWKDCDVTCGGGNQTRERTCTGPFYGGAPCNGSWNDTQECNTFPCPGKKESMSLTLSHLLLLSSSFHKISPRFVSGFLWHGWFWISDKSVSFVSVA